MMTGLRCLLTGVLLVSTSTAWGATYYLAPNGSNASGRNGSWGQPWKTLNYAMDRMNGGDDLVLKAGTYNISSTQWLWRSGTSSNRTVIRAANNANVLIDASGISQQWTDAIKINGNYITFKDINVRGNIRGGGILIHANHVVVDSCDSYDHGAPAIQVRGEVNQWNQTPNHCVIQFCAAWNTCLMNNPNHWNYQGWQDIGGFWPFAIGGIMARNCKVRNCWSGENYGEGIAMSRVRGGSSEIRDCYARDNYSVNIYTDGVSGGSNNYVSIKNNTAETQFLSRFYRSGSPAHNFVIAAENYDGDLVGSNPTRYVEWTGNVARDGGHNYLVADLGKPVSHVWIDGNTAQRSTWGNYKQHNTSRVTQIWVGSNTGF